LHTVHGHGMSPRHAGKKCLAAGLSSRMIGVRPTAPMPKVGDRGGGARSLKVTSCLHLVRLHCPNSGRSAGTVCISCVARSRIRCDAGAGRRWPSGDDAGAAEQQAWRRAAGRPAALLRQRGGRATESHRDAPCAAGRFPAWAHGRACHPRRCTGSARPPAAHGGRSGGHMAGGAGQASAGGGPRPSADRCAACRAATV
jgi:hypothetical protein